MKKIIYAILGIFICTQVGFAQGKKIVADKIVGIVGDRIILQSDIKNSISDLMRQGGTVPENAECMMLDQAMLSKVMMLQAIKDSIPVSDEDVEAELDLRMRNAVRMYGNVAAVEQVAGKTIYQIKDEARESVREAKLAEGMQRKILEGVKITPAEVKTFFEKIPKDSLPFFESEFEIGQIVIYPKASRDMEKYVMDELNNYKKQVETKLASFDQLAKRYSEDPGSKDKGGFYQIDRNDKQWDPAFMAAAFKLKNGEISPVIKSKFGYHIIQMVERNGDEADVRHILRKAPITEIEIAEATSKLDSVRSKIVSGLIGFPIAAGRYSEDEITKVAGPYILSRNGSSLVPIDELDKDVVVVLDKLKIGEISQPLTYTDERDRKAVRILYLKSRSEPHRMNLKDDYDRIGQSALEEKKYAALEKWMNAHMQNYYIMIDTPDTTCPQLQKWTSAQRATASH